MVPGEEIEKIPHTPVEQHILPGYDGEKPVFSPLLDEWQAGASQRPYRLPGLQRSREAWWKALRLPV